MEKIYDPKRLNATENINLKEYFNDYSEHLHELQKQTADIDLNEKIFSFINDESLDQEKRDMLVSSCSVNKLTVPGEYDSIAIGSAKKIMELTKTYARYKITEEAKELHTIKKLKARLEKAETKQCLQKEIKLSQISLNVRPDGPGENDLSIGTDIIIYARLFRPYYYTYRQPNQNCLIFDQEIALLGSNTLADFRDKISCSMDLVVFTDFSNNIKEEHSKVRGAQDEYPSGFIFIDDTFYNDFRAEKSIDYSEVLRKWAMEKGIGTFATAEMKDVRLDSLKPRFGYPYVYQHQGRCEHLFVFSNAKLINNSDLLVSSLYPFHSNFISAKICYCVICGIAGAVWIVEDCDRLPQNWAPLCNDCLLSYCYINEKKVGNFKAYPYMNKSALF